MSRFDAARFAELATARALSLGQPLVAVEETDSTNDLAMAAARAGAAHGACFVAETQRAGRGRRGRRWLSPPGQSLLLSVVLRPALSPATLGALTLALGLATRDAIAERIPTPPTIKWPNDVLAAGKKIAGILVESQIDGGAVSAVIAGIGINVASRELPEELEGSATSLALQGADRLGREELLCSLLAAVTDRLASYVQSGLTTLHPELLRHDALCGQRLRIDSLQGVARGIAEDGALLLEDERGSMHRVLAGTVELIP